MSRAYKALALAFLLGGTGCAAGGGAIYTHVTTPLDLDLERTPVHEGYGTDSWKTFYYYVQVDWGSDGIGDVSKKLGMTRIHYADLETLSILGIWTERTVHVYGER